MAKKTGEFYNGLKVVHCRTELWKTVAKLLSEKYGKKVTMKDIRKAYSNWYGSVFTMSLSFGDFVDKLYSTNETRTVPDDTTGN